PMGRVSALGSIRFVGERKYPLPKPLSWPGGRYPRIPQGRNSTWKKTKSSGERSKGSFVGTGQRLNPKTGRAASAAFRPDFVFWNFPDLLKEHRMTPRTLVLQETTPFASVWTPQEFARGVHPEGGSPHQKKET